jgi:RNA polymerase sigma factor for flagellar operon FliA
MLDELRAMDWVPRLTRARANKLQDTYARLEKEHGRAPTDVELARAMRMTIEQLDALYREVSGASLVSLQRKPLEKDDNILGVDIMEDAKIEGPVLESAKKDFLEFCKKNLSTKERYILMMYYFDDLTLKEIGTILGLSESRVCQLHAKLITRLRNFAKRRRSGM